jgi:hypothetical protein
VVDHGRLDRQEFGDAPRAEADLQELNDPPARLLFRRILVVRAKPEEQMLRSQGQSYALGMGVGSTERAGCWAGGEARGTACRTAW